MKTMQRLLWVGSTVALVAALGRCGDESTPNTTFDLAVNIPDLSELADLSMPPPPVPDMSRLPAPMITAISPAIGVSSGGTPLTITGTGFQAAATVGVAGVACQNVTVVSATSITCTTAAKPLTCGTVPVVVTNPDAQSVTDSKDFSLRGTALALAPATNLATDVNPQFLKVADVNADGKLDLIVANAGANTLSLRLGNGDGTFGSATDVAVSTVAAARASTIATGDVNDDSGRTDCLHGRRCDLRGVWERLRAV